MVHPDESGAVPRTACPKCCRPGRALPAA